MTKCPIYMGMFNWGDINVYVMTQIEIGKDFKLC